eukprot:gnl/TRDRNA2_/TRDRNA2_61475_c0_seq1.p1 gnl/TRDRNA2_/TRDRNA2_61475_c0~~gnl/TRDRNA2_/TRDRNA2_61475_c0_seq1.p1  ORF type:complete len:360 (+),score=39.12 gnl/TRDRNA2_/TRDRNA2_61475_c0_seq1:70-1149(+)
MLVGSILSARKGISQCVRHEALSLCSGMMTTTTARIGYECRQLRFGKVVHAALHYALVCGTFLIKMNSGAVRLQSLAMGSQVDTLAHSHSIAQFGLTLTRARGRLQYPPTSFADPDDFQAAAAFLLGAGTEEIGNEVDFIYVRHRHAAASCEGELKLGIEECVLGIYFEVLGVRGFGSQVTSPDFLPKRTKDLWAKIRCSAQQPATLAPTEPCDNLGLRFDRHASSAFELLHKHLANYSDSELCRWVQGAALTDGTRKRTEIRGVFLNEMLPALVSRLASDPSRFGARTLAHAVICCVRIGHASTYPEFLNAVSLALRVRLSELHPMDTALQKKAAEALGDAAQRVDALPTCQVFEAVD